MGARARRTDRDDFPGPLLSLNPVMRVRDQISEAIRAHGSVENGRIETLLGRVGLPATDRIAKAYPHELSGGERQRISIALALACSPALVIADEPFTALDAPRVVELSALFARLREESGASFLLIDHSPAVLAQMADRILVMYAGQVVETGPREQVMAEPLHPYTTGLLRCLPRIGARSTWPRSGQFAGIGGAWLHIRAALRGTHAALCRRGAGRIWRGGAARALLQVCRLKPC